MVHVNGMKNSPNISIFLVLSSLKLINVSSLITLQKGFLILIAYVVDLLISGSFEVLIEELKNSLNTAFTIKDLGLAKYFLGLEISQSPTGIYVNQKKYIFDLVTNNGLLHAKATEIPLSKELFLRV